MKKCHFVITIIMDFFVFNCWNYFRRRSGCDWRLSCRQSRQVPLWRANILLTGFFLTPSSGRKLCFKIRDSATGRWERLIIPVVQYSDFPGKCHWWRYKNTSKMEGWEEKWERKEMDNRLLYDTFPCFTKLKSER